MGKTGELNTSREKGNHFETKWPEKKVQGFANWTLKEKTSERIERMGEWKQKSRMSAE